MNFSQDEPNSDFKLPQGYHDAISGEQDSLFAGISSTHVVSKAHAESIEDSAFFNQIESKPTNDAHTQPTFQPVTGNNIFMNNSQTNQLGFENTSNSPNLLDSQDFNYPEQHKEPEPSIPSSKNLPVLDSPNDWTAFLSSSSKPTIPVPKGIDPSKQVEIEARLASYEPKDQDPYISRVEILRLSEIITVEEEATLYKLMITKRDLVIKALDAQNKTGSTIILDELLGRKKNTILPDTVINIDDLGTETVSVKTLASLSHRSSYPDMFVYDGCLCTIIQSRTATRFSFNNKWEDIFIMIGHNEIRIYDNIQQAANFEDPHRVITLSSYMNTCEIYDKKYTGIRIHILKLVENPEGIRHKNNLFVFDDQYETEEILKIGSTSQQTVLIVKTQIQALLNVLKQKSMKAAQAVENHTTSYRD